MKQFFRVLLFGAAVMLGSCVPEFDNPLPCKQVEADARLLGNWRTTTKEGGEQNRLAFHARTNGWYDIVFLTGLDKRADTNGIDCTLYEGFSTRIKERSFLCLRLRARDFKNRTDAPKHYRFLIAGYDVGRQNLEIRILSKSKVKDLIEAGVLQGQVGQDNTNGSVVVTSTPEALQNALGKVPDEELFGDPMRFKRIR